MKKKIKTKIKLAIYIILTSFAITHLTFPVMATAPAERQNFLPINPDKENLSVPEQIRLLAYKSKFQWPDYLVKLAFCESRFDQWATNLNGGHSLDRGLFQINQRYHPEVSSECAFSIECATKWTMEQINAGRQGMWTCDKKINKL